MIDYEKFWSWLRVTCRYSLSFDGKSGDVDSTMKCLMIFIATEIYVMEIAVSKELSKSNDVSYESYT